MKTLANKNNRIIIVVIYNFENLKIHCTTELMDDHRTALQRLCRICGENIPRGAKQWDKNKKRKQILSCYNIDIDNDSNNIHPPLICNGCCTRMSRIEAARWKRLYTQSAGMATWQEHSELCKVCSRKPAKGRPSKACKNRGRPPGETANETIQYIRNASAPNWAKNVHIERVSTSQVNPSHLSCTVCKCIVDSPVELQWG